MWLLSTSFAALGVLSYTCYIGVTGSIRDARKEGQQEGTKHVLENLVKLGPSRIRRMCLENGIRFTERPNSENDHREIQESLHREIREQLRKEQRQSMMHGVKKEIRTELKLKYRSELTKNGLDKTIVAEARADLREETREKLKKELRSSVRTELREEERYTVRRLLEIEERDNIRAQIRAEEQYKIEPKDCQRDSCMKRLEDLERQLRHCQNTAYATTTRR